METVSIVILTAVTVGIAGYLAGVTMTLRRFAKDSWFAHHVLETLDAKCAKCGRPITIRMDNSPFGKPDGHT